MQIANRKPSGRLQIISSIYTLACGTSSKRQSFVRRRLIENLIENLAETKNKREVPLNSKDV